MFKFHCPRCQQKISADTSQVGLAAQCPTCGGDFVVPDAPEATEPTEPPIELMDESQLPGTQDLSGSDAVTPTQESGAKHSFDARLKDGSMAMKKGARIVKEGSMVGWSGLKRKSKQAALRAQIEKLRQIDLRRAFHALGERAFEQDDLADTLIDHYQTIRELDANIARLRERNEVESGESKIATLKRMGKETAKAGQAQALTVKREHSITELGRAIHARKDQIIAQNSNDEIAAITNNQRQIQEIEEQIRALDDGGKGRIQTLAVAAAIVIAVTVGAVLISKTKSNDEIANKDAPRTSQPDSANEQDFTAHDNQDDDEASGPTLDLAKYAKESAERKSRQNQAQQQDFEANGLKDSHDYHDYKALLERHIRYKALLEGAATRTLGDEGKVLSAFIAIIKTDWSNCSPSLKERAESVKKTTARAGEKNATDDFIEAVKSLNDLSAKIGKRLSTNQLLVQQREHIINEINKKIATSKSLPHADKANDATLHESMDDITRGLLKSAERGVAIAQYLLAGRYHYGIGVDINYELAAKWYEKAANQGNVEAQFSLGSLYYLGEGVTKDYTQAEKWFRKAAENGNDVSQYHLGNLYWEGEGVTKNQDEAIKWYIEAAKKGNDRAKTKLNNLHMPQSDPEKRSSAR